MSEHCKNCEKLQQEIRTLKQYCSELLAEKNAMEIGRYEYKQENEKLEEELDKYKKDRFCQGGCAIYQYDKIAELKQQLQAEREKVKKLEERLSIAKDGETAWINQYKLAHQKRVKPDVVNTKYKQALDEIEGKLEELITHTPEYDNCYYKDYCGEEKCPPKKTQKFDICLYQEVDNILDIISKAKGEENGSNI